MAQTLAVTGAVALASTLTAGATTLASLGVTGDVAVNTNRFNVTASNGNTAIAGTLGVTGAVSLASTLGVTGATTLASLGVTGAATVGTTLGVTGAATLASTLAAGATTLASLGVTGAATVGTTLGVTGAATFGAAPSGLGAAVRQASVVLSRTLTTTIHAAVEGETVWAPTGSASGSSAGVFGVAATASGNAQNLTASIAGLVGVGAVAGHAGSGVVTGVAAFRAFPITNTGGGTITNSYGLYLVDQTAATNNWGLYQVGANVVNYMAGKLGIGVTSPDATALLDLRSSDTQIHLGSSTKHGYIGGNNSVGTTINYRATSSGATWTARGTAATTYRQNGAAHIWTIDSGLTDGNTFTPTDQMGLTATSAGAALTIGTAQTLVGSSSWALSAAPVFTVTSGNRMAGAFHSIANPSANSTAVHFGITGYAAVGSGNAFDLTTAFGLRGGYFRVYNQGSGTVTGSAGVMIESAVNNGGGTITNLYGLYIAAQTVGTNNWGLYQVGTTTPNFLAGPIRMGTTGGPLWQTGSGSPEGAVTAPIGSLYTRTDGGASTTLYVKESGTGDTGWIAK
jgi:hypothetical protein